MVLKIFMNIGESMQKIIVPKKKGEDGYKVTSVRLPEELLDRLNRFTARTELSRSSLRHDIAGSSFSFENTVRESISIFN